MNRKQLYTLLSRTSGPGVQEVEQMSTLGQTSFIEKVKKNSGFLEAFLVCSKAAFANSESAGWSRQRKSKHSALCLRTTVC